MANLDPPRTEVKPAGPAGREGRRYPRHDCRLEAQVWTGNSPLRMGPSPMFRPPRLLCRNAETCELSPAHSHKAGHGRNAILSRCDGIYKGSS